MNHPIISYNFNFQQSVVRICEEIIEEFITAGKTFTDFEVSQAIHNKIRYHNIGQDIRETIESYDELDSRACIKSQTLKDGTIKHNIKCNEYFLKDTKENNASTSIILFKKTTDSTLDNAELIDQQRQIDKFTPPNKEATNTSYITINSTNRLCVPKKFMDQIYRTNIVWIAPSKGGDITIYANSLLATSNSIALRVDKHGYLAIRKKYLTNNKYKVTVVNSNDSILLTPVPNTQFSLEKWPIKQ